MAVASLAFAATAYFASGSHALRAPAGQTAASGARAGPVRPGEARGSGAGPYRARAGQVLRYGYRADCALEVRGRAEIFPVVQVRLEGEMTVAVLARRGDELIAEVAFPRTTGTMAQGGEDIRAAEDLLQDLARGALVRMRDDGSTLGHAFGPGLPPGHREWIRRLWSACRFVARPTPGEPWTAVEDGAIGPAEVEYRWRAPVLEGTAAAGGLLQRTMLGYGDEARARWGAVAAAGEGEAHLNPAIGWFEQARWTETVTRGPDEHGAAATAMLAADWRLREVRFRAAGGAGGEALWDREWLPAGGASEAGPEGGVRQLAAALLGLP